MAYSKKIMNLKSENFRKPTEQVHVCMKRIEIQGQKAQCYKIVLSKDNTADRARMASKILTKEMKNSLKIRASTAKDSNVKKTLEGRAKLENPLYIKQASRVIPPCYITNYFIIIK